MCAAKSNDCAKNQQGKPEIYRISVVLATLHFFSFFLQFQEIFCSVCFRIRMGKSTHAHVWLPAGYLWESFNNFVNNLNTAIDKMICAIKRWNINTNRNTNTHINGDSRNGKKRRKYNNRKLMMVICLLVVCSSRTLHRSLNLCMCARACVFIK